jgi:hypothetical protein
MSNSPLPLAIQFARRLCQNRSHEPLFVHMIATQQNWVKRLTDGTNEEHDQFN